MFGILNIKGTVLDREQLEAYMEKLASDDVLQNKASKDTYPIPRMMENFEKITKVYLLLNEHLKLGINIHPAGEWILDNYYSIEEAVKTIRNDLSLKKYTNFLGLASGTYKGYARIYVLAAQMVAYTENNITRENLIYMLQAYQNKKNLNMDEIWNIGIFLQIAIIENITWICDKIYASQMQKYRVENIVERLIESKPKEEQRFKNDVGYRSQKFGFGEMKYPFIEYMSYKLKKSGRKAYSYLDALEEQVNKMGTSVSEVIKKEHFDIAIRKVSMANSIISIKSIARMNFQEVFEKINGVEEVLKEDPANVYMQMDYKTKEYYRNQIKEISKKTKISEMYIAKKLVELAQKEEDTNSKRAHIGYFLISKGRGELLQSLGVQARKASNWKKETKVKAYITAIYLPTIVFAIAMASYIGKSLSWIIGIIIGILVVIPLSEIFTQLIQYVLNKIVKPKLIPKIDLSRGIPVEDSTIVVIPTIIKSKEKVQGLMEKLEVYYLANKTENLYFALLGDCTSSEKENEEYDEEVIQAGKEAVAILNKKYPDERFPKFHFLYRKRVWNDSQKCFLGWERKRGLLNQFNEYILFGEQADFICNTLEEEKQQKEIPTIPYLITLDADTDLILNSAFELVGAMAHILNKPVVDAQKNVVIEGHALLQPKVGIDLIASRKSIFTKIFAGAGGTDLYTNAISDTYQDNFGEGIFTGKGIYNIPIFEQVLKSEIPNNTVLSHDLLEGSYLRCGLASDILLMDGYPCKYNAFMSRLHRWIRGDWQILNWLGKQINRKDGSKKINPLNLLSKYKIFDNLRRSILEIASILLLIVAFFLKRKQSFSIWPILTIGIIAIIIPMCLELINRIVYRKDGEEKQKMFSPVIHGWKGSLLRAILSLAFLPDKAYLSLNAIVKTLYRKFVSKQNMLEWTTAEEAEKNAKTDYLSYYKNMIANIVCAILLFIVTIILDTTFIKVLGTFLSILWLIAPAIACYISKEEIEKVKLEELTKEEKEYVLEIARKTWLYFKENLTQENNYLPSDNYQEGRREKLVYRTSSTNIGLALLAVISSYDLEFENLEDTLILLENMLITIEKLSKWNGHLYNWYEIRTLKPLVPRYVSTVDSGNFVGYLYVLKQFLLSIEKKDENTDKITMMLAIVNKLIENTDFSILYDEKTRLFSIGFNVEENKLTDCYYDLLASEARQASLIAISKKDVPAKHWNNLSRTLTTMNKYQGLISWSGTAFEYLMPNINIRRYKGSLLDESCKFSIMSQKEYSKKLGIPWGMSEAAFNLKDLNCNYQYKAFGVPWLGLKRGLADEAVVSAYGSILAITDYPKEVVENIKRLDKQGMMGKYGLYEAIDYTSTRLKYGENNAVVKTFMAHHQGLILLSINNLFHNNILQERFSDNPEIKAVDILLQERMPENIIITKEKKEKPEKLKYKDYESYSEKVYTKAEEPIEKWNVIANEDYSILTNQKGESYSKYQDIYINRYKETAEQWQGISFFLKNINTKRIWTAGYRQDMPKPDRYSMHFMPDSIKVTRLDGNIETITKTTIVANEPVEIRSMEIRNHGTEEEILEVTSFFEPVISSQAQDISHMAFNNLFLRYSMEEDGTMVIERKAREQNVDNTYLAVNLYTENETIGELEYEIDKERFHGRGNLGIPQMIESSKPFSRTIGLVTEPIVAFKRTIRIPPKERVTLNLIISVGHEKQKVLTQLEDYKNKENITKTFELSKARAVEEARYLEMKGTDLELYQEILSLLIQNPTKKLYINKYTHCTYAQQDLWKFGISGDYPILLVKIRDVNDIYVVEELIKAYEFLKIKNVKMELVILNREKYSYEQYVTEAIENAILNRHLAYMKNTRCGIFIINSNDLSKEDKNLLEYRANLIVDAHLGNLKSQIELAEEEYKNSIKNIGEMQPKQIIVEEEKIRGNHLDKKDVIDNLKYYNEYGAFANDGKEYIIKVNKDNNLPTVWSHVLANPNFGTVVTEGMGGYTWNQNSRLNRITAWSNNPTFDIPSEIIYIKDNETGKAWSLGSRPMPDENDYYITYGFGYAKYEHTSLGMLQEAEVFVPTEDNVKITLLNLKNTTPKKKKLTLFYYMKPVLGEDEINSNGNIMVQKDNNIVYAKNLYTSEFKEEKAYIGCSEEIKSYTGSKDFFIGDKTIQNPKAINKVSLDNNNGLSNDSCMAIEIEIELEAYERKEISFILGEENTLLDAKTLAYQYSNISNCKQELNKTKKYWYDIVNKVQIKTPMESFNILLNGWIVYQTITSRLYGKTGYYQSGGALGFRDQLQDTLGLKYIDPEIMRKQIIKHSKHQFIEGDVEHWWHEEVNKGIRTRFSDDLLFLPFVTTEYIEFTGDFSLLEEQVPYLKGKLLEEGMLEQYDSHLESEVQGSIYEHCIKAIDRALQFGENGLPKIGSGDWNDGFSNVGPQGKGESVWLGFFLYTVLSRFIPIMLEKQDMQKVEEYEQIKQNLKRALNKNGWDGRWYKRAFMDNGDVLGSIENEECRIDSIAQSWSVISQAGDNDKKYISMESLENHLVDRENAIIKLLDPPFDKGKLEPGYIKSYLPGVRENGGQYTHGAVWAVIAEALLGFGDKAVEFFKIISPIEHSRTKEAAQKYKVEPYVIAADIYGAGNLGGRGGWTWYTGSSSWLYKAGIEYILGLQIEKGYLRIQPCITKEWNEYSIRYRYGNSLYNIRVKNPDAKNTGVTKFIVNGEEIEEKQIKLIDDGHVYEIEIIM